jgi:hypothetical protein
MHLVAYLFIRCRKNHRHGGEVMSDQEEARRTILFIVAAILFGYFALGIGRDSPSSSRPLTEDVILLG